MKLLWTAPALEWKPLSGAAATIFAYVLASGWAGSSAYPRMEVMLPLFVGFFIPVPRHLFARFARTDATEWLMGMGADRRKLAFRFAVDLVWWSAVHAAGASVLVSLVPNFELFRDREWTPAYAFVRFPFHVFLVQLTARSLFAIVAHADRSTLVPARMKDEFAGVRTSFRTTFVWFLAALALLIAFAGGPIALVAATGSFFWLAVPAALYLRLAHAMASTSEFIRKTSAPVDDWGLPLPSPALPPPREFFGDLRSDGAASAPLRGLLWNGLGKGMKHIFYILLGLVAGAGIWWIATKPYDRELPEKFVLLFAAVIPVFFALAGQKIFAWNRSEEAIEYLFVRGVTLRTLDRVRMARGLIVAGLVFGAMAFFHVAVFEGKGVTLPFWSVVCYVGAALLLECNRREMPVRVIRCRTYAELGRLFRVAWWFSYPVGAVAARLAGWETTARAGFVLGLLFVVPALLAWIRTAVPLYVRR